MRALVSWDVKEEIYCFKISFFSPWAITFTLCFLRSSTYSLLADFMFKVSS